MLVAEKVGVVLPFLVGHRQAVAEGLNRKGSGGVHRGAAEPVRSDGDSQLLTGFRKGLFGKVIDHPTEVADPVEQGAGTANDFDTVNVDGIRGVLTTEPVAEGVLDHETTDLERGIALVAGGSLRIVDVTEIVEGPVSIVLRLEQDSGAVFQGIPQVGGPGILDKLGGDDLDRQGHVLDGDVDAGSGNGIGGIVTAVLFSGDFERGEFENHLVRGIRIVIRILRVKGDDGRSKGQGGGHGHRGKERLFHGDVVRLGR